MQFMLHQDPQDTTTHQNIITCSIYMHVSIPQLERSTPRIKMSTPPLERSTPWSPPRIKMSTPRIKMSTPRVNISTPHYEQHTPQLQNNIPQASKCNIQHKWTSTNKPCGSAIKHIRHPILKFLTPPLPSLPRLAISSPNNCLPSPDWPSPHPTSAFHSPTGHLLCPTCQDGTSKRQSPAPTWRFPHPSSFETPPERIIRHPTCQVLPLFLAPT